MKRLQKLLSLSSAEIIFRLREKGLEAGEFLLHQVGRDRLDEERFLARVGVGTASASLLARREALARMWWQGRGTRFFTETWNRQQRLERMRAHPLYARTLSEAERILSGSISLLGHDWRFAEADWQADPVTGEQWPDDFYTRVIPRSASLSGDIKDVWEVNRHQYLIVLAKAYYLTGEERYARPVVEAISSWIATNPFRRGVNWTSSLELAVRALSWLWAVFLCQGSASVTDEFVSRLLMSLYEHGRQIERHLSVWSSPYNHLIGEVAALHLIGGLCPFFPEGRRWEENGWRMMADSVERQFHSDGVTVEQATFYHHFTLGFYVQSVIFRRINGKEVTESVAERLLRACEASLYLSQPDGELPRIGDIDNARSLYFSVEHSWDFRGFLGLGAWLFEQPELLQPLAGPIPEELLWLADDHGLDRYLAMRPKEPEFSSRALHRSGYFIMRDSWRPESNYLLFDCGEIAHGLHAGPIPSAAHGHADALSFELSAFGQPFLVDGGFYTYFGPLDWHRYFREEEAHNTVRVDGFRQANYCGRLTWQQVRRPGRGVWKANRLYDYAAGKINLGEKVRHERQVLYLKGAFWLLVDRVSQCPAAVPIDSYFHFHSAVELSVRDDAPVAIARRAEGSLLVRPFGNVALEAQKGGKAPGDGWVGEGYGFRCPAWRLACRWPETGVAGTSVVVPTLLVPFKGESDAIRIAEVPPQAFGGWDCEVAIDQGPHCRIRVGADGGIRLETGDGIILMPPARH